MTTPYYQTFAQAQIKSKANGWKGDCQIFARESFKIPSDGTKDAATAWKNAKHKHPGDTKPPAGTFVFWTGGGSGHGHVAVSWGNGKVSSTDFGPNGYLGDGQVHMTTIAAINKDSNLHYAGWTEDNDGVRVYEPPAPAPAPTPKPVTVPYPGESHFKLGHSDPAVTQLGQWMVKAGLTPFHVGSVYTPGPVYSSYDVANVKHFQQAQGWTGADADGYPGPETWKLVQAAAAKA